MDCPPLPEGVAWNDPSWAADGVAERIFALLWAFGKLLGFTLLLLWRISKLLLVGIFKAVLAVSARCSRQLLWLTKQ